MNQKDFKRIARLLKLVYQELQAEAEKNGLDLLSPEYNELISLARQKVLDRVGFTLDEYREAKNLYLSTKDGQMDESTRTRLQALDGTYVPTEEKLLAVAHEVSKQYIKPPQIINKIVKETTKVIEKPQIIETIIKEKTEYLDPPKPEPIDTSAIELKLNTKLEERLNDFQENFKHNTDILEMPDFRKLAMGLQGQIDDLRALEAADGDVVGPSSSANNRVVFFDGTTGKLIKDSGLTLSGSNTGDQTITLTGEVTGAGTGSFATTLLNSAVIGKVLTGYTSGAGVVAATDTILQAIQKLNGNDATNANLTGVITSVGNATSIASQTGTGSKFVVDTSPTIVTPIITQIVPGANFTLKQNSVNVFTSEETGGIVNTLYLKAGNVGIGTTNPQSQLAFGLGSDASGVKTYTTDGQAGLNFYRDSGGTNKRYLDIYATASGNDASAGGSIIRFLTHTTSSAVSATERMRIDNAGNVGIGTTGPNKAGFASTVVTINGASTNPGTLEIGRTTGATTGVAGNLSFYSGSVAQLFDIVASNDGATNSGRLDFKPNNAGAQITALTILNGGNVGIGTTGPGYPLDVQTSGGGILRIKSTSAGAAAYENIANDTVNGFLAVASNSGSGQIWGTGGLANTLNLGTSGAYAMLFATNNTVRMVIDSSGYVGIGTTDPEGYPLEVQAASGNILNLKGTAGGGTATQRIANGTVTTLIGVNGTTADAVWGTGGLASVGIFGTASNHGIQFATNSTVRLSIDTSGIATFKSSSTGADTLTINNSSGKVNVKIGGGGSSANYGQVSIFDNSDVKTVSLNSDSTDVSYIKSKFGIGLTNPSYTLDVTGTAGFNGLSASGVGDTYVCLSTGKELRTGATCAASTEKIKDDIVSLTDSLAQVLNLNPVSFTYKEGFHEGRDDIGFIVEEVAKIDPRLVFHAPNDETLPDGSEIKEGDPMALNTNALLSLAIQAIKEQQLRIELLETRLLA